MFLIEGRVTFGFVSTLPLIIEDFMLQFDDLISKNVVYVAAFYNDLIAERLINE